MEGKGIAGPFAEQGRCRFRWPSGEASGTV